MESSFIDNPKLVLAPHDEVHVDICDKTVEEASGCFSGKSKNSKSDPDIALTVSLAPLASRPDIKDLMKVSITSAFLIWLLLSNA